MSRRHVLILDSEGHGLPVDTRGRTFLNLFMYPVSKLPPGMASKRYVYASNDDHDAPVGTFPPRLCH